MPRILTILLLASLLISGKVFPSALDDAISRFDNQQYDLALTDLVQLAKDKTASPEIYYYLARSQFHAGLIEEAEESLNTLLDQMPDYVEGHYLLGSVLIAKVNQVSLFRKVGVAKAALAAWKKTVELDPNHIEGQYAVASFYMTAPGFAGGDNKKAEAEMTRLGELSEPWKQLAVGAFSEKQKDFDAAETNFRQASRAITERAFPLYVLASYYLRMEKYDQALEALKAYETRTQTWNDPEESMVAMLKGQIFAGMGNKETAKVELNRALNLVVRPDLKSLVVAAIEEL